MVETEKREENLRALCIDKQCIADLERKLHERQVESAEIMFVWDQAASDSHTKVRNEATKRIEKQWQDAKRNTGKEREGDLSRKLANLPTREEALAEQEVIINKKSLQLMNTKLHLKN